MEDQTGSPQFRLEGKENRLCNIPLLNSTYLAGLVYWVIKIRLKQRFLGEILHETGEQLHPTIHIEVFLLRLI
jgi:hypothetical protein